MTVKTTNETDQLKFLNTVNISSYADANYTLVYGGSYGTIVFNMQKTKVYNNTFTKNYAGLNGAILSLEGFPYVEVNSTSFTYNGNNIPDFVTRYSTIELLVQLEPSIVELFRDVEITDEYLAAYNDKMSTILNIDMTNLLTLTGLTFQYNWVIDQGATGVASHTMIVKNIYKSFGCSS